MLRELKTSQINEYRKLLRTVLDGLDTASKVRSHLIDFDSASKMEIARCDSLNDPEPFYHLKLFDKAIGIVRLYDSREWSNNDPDKKYFHFAIRCYNFCPTETYKLRSKLCRSYSTYGDFLDIADALPYFNKFINDLMYKINVTDFNSYVPLEIY